MILTSFGRIFFTKDATLLWRWSNIPFIIYLSRNFGKHPCWIVRHPATLCGVRNIIPYFQTRTVVSSILGMYAIGWSNRTLRVCNSPNPWQFLATEEQSDLFCVSIFSCWHKMYLVPTSQFWLPKKEKSAITCDTVLESWIVKRRMQRAIARGTTLKLKFNEVQCIVFSVKGLLHFIPPPSQKAPPK